MGENKYVSWGALGLLVIAIVVLLLLIFGVLESSVAPWGLGILAALAAIFGLLTFRTTQGKVAAIGGVVILVGIVFITPVSSTGSPSEPQPGGAENNILDAGVVEI